MIINFLGDSITEGYSATSKDNCYVSLAGKILNCKVNNYGICGTRIARQSIPSFEPSFDLDYCSRAKDLDPNADFTIVFGGTNDYGHGDAPIGKLGDKTPFTFYGAVQCLIDELLKRFKKEQIIFLSPLYRFNENDPLGDGSRIKPTIPLQGYRDVLKEVVEKNDIKYFDVKDQFGKPEDTDLFSDGLHPNDKGHQKLAEILANYIAKRQKNNG